MDDLDRWWSVLSAHAVTDVLRPGGLAPAESGPAGAVSSAYTCYLELGPGRHLRLEQPPGECEVSMRLAAPAPPEHLDPDDEFVLLSVGGLFLPSTPLPITGLRLMLHPDDRVACLELRFPRGRTLLADPWGFDGLELSAADLGWWCGRMHAGNLSGLRRREWSAGTE